MNTPKSIIAVAEARFNEAEALHQAGLHEGAMYLAGYALELLLKAKISERLDIPNLFDDNFVQSMDKQVSGLVFRFPSDFRKFFLVHDLAKLFLLTGLRNRFNADKGADRSQKMMNAWTCICDTEWMSSFGIYRQTQNQRMIQNDLLKR